MQLISVQCSHCGAPVQIDSYNKSFICNICGGSTIIEQNNYNNSYHDENIQKAELLINNQNNYKEAKNKFEYMTTSYPDDPRPWQGLMRCYTKDLSIKLYLDVSPYQPIWLSGLESRFMDAYNNYLKVETKEPERSRAIQVVNEYIENNKREFEELQNKYKETDPIPTSSINSSEPNFTETIKAENKIINSDDILNIIKKMDDSIKKYKFIYQKEEELNKSFDFNEKEYTFKDSDSKLKFDIDFHDNTSITTDNLDEFYYVYENRLGEIKSLTVSYLLHYYIEKPKPNKVSEYISQNIYLYIKEDKLSVDVKMDSKDDKLSVLYNDFKQIILSAPTKYDSVIKNRTGISLVCGLAIGLIPSMLITLILYFMTEPVKILFGQSLVVYPLLNIVGALVIGETISFLILDRLYSNIKPSQKYAGYKDGQSVHVDDVEEYVNKSEVLIGKNVNNMKDRESIKSLYSKCKKLLLINLAILAILSIIVVVLYNMAE